MSAGADGSIRIISRRHQPWAWFDKRVITRYGHHLGPHGIAVYMALAVHVDGDTQTCFPSYRTLAYETGLSRPTVVKAMKTLVALGLVGKEAMQSPDGDAGPNLYSLLDIPIYAENEGATASAGVVNDVNHPSKPPLPPVVNDVNPNKNQGERDTKNKKAGQAFSHEKSGKAPNLAARKAVLRQQAEQLQAQGL
jgi:DNA-binding transcriptional MocR family regulator